MSQWPSRPLAELLLPTDQRDPRRQPTEPFVYVDIASVDNETKTITVAEPIFGQEAPSRARKVIRAGDVLVSTVRPNLNAVALVPDQLDGEICSTGFSVLRPSKELVSKYLFGFVRSSLFIGTLVSMTKGANYPAVSDRDVKGVCIPAPPLAEQERIVRLLDEADAIRKLRAQADQRTADLIPALFHDMFGDPITNPMGWPITRLSDVADVQGGLQLSPKRASYDLRRPYLRVANVQRGRLDLSEIKSIDLTQDEYGRVKLRSGDLLLVEGNGNPKEVGRAAIWDGSIDGVVHQNHLIRVRTKPEVLRSEFLLSFINSDAGRSFFVESGNSTSGLVTISTGIVKSCRFPMPSSDVQQRFVERIASVQATRSRQSHSMVAGQAAFEAVLDGVFTTKD